MKTSRGSRSLAPLIPNLNTRRSSVVKFTPRQVYLRGKHRCPLSRKLCGGHSRSGHSLWRDSVLFLQGNQTADRPGPNFVIIPRTVSRLHLVKMRIMKTPIIYFHFSPSSCYCRFKWPDSSCEASVHISLTSRQKLRLRLYMFYFQTGL
jgi:hypothetical protein